MCVILKGKVNEGQDTNINRHKKVGININEKKK